MERAVNPFVRFVLALFLGLLIGSVLLWGAEQFSGPILPGVLGYAGIFVAGFVGMSFARERPILYSMVLGVIPLSIIYTVLAVQSGDPILGALWANLRQIAAIFGVVLAGAAAARFVILKNPTSHDV